MSHGAKVKWSAKIRDIIGVEEMEYAVIYERTATGYSAYAPDLPGCIAAGRTLRETEKLMREAIELHLRAITTAD
jgi:predicted RNase H-like HicB family nuclease